MIEYKIKSAYNKDFTSFYNDFGIEIVKDTKSYNAISLYAENITVEPDYFYDFFVNLKTSFDYRIYYIFYDEKGLEFSKGYLNKKDIIYVPKECKDLKIEYLFLADGVGSISVSPFDIKKKEKRKERKVRIATIPFEDEDIEPVSYDEIAKRLSDKIDKVSKENPDIILLTEAVFQTRIDIENENEYPVNTLYDKRVNMLREKAKKYNTYIACSIKEKDDKGYMHNTGIIIDRKGEIAGTTRKTHLTMGELEGGIKLEDNLPVFDTDFGRVGLLICWEHFFPEVTRIMQLKGVEILLVSTHGFNIHRTITRALDNGYYVASSYVSKKGCVIVAPNGKVLSTAENEKGYAFSEIDLSIPIYAPWLSAESNAIPNNIYLNERRPEMYDILTKK